MRILILGHRGMLGSELHAALSSRHDVTGKDAAEFDIASAADCRRVIADVKPDVVINAAAYTDVDGSETQRDLCFAVNAEGVKNVALACRSDRVKIIHFSTDYVFDGIKEAPYREEDPCRPLNVYGEAKLAGEKYLQQYGEDYLLIRTAWLYGRQGRNFVKAILGKAREVGKLDVVNDQRGSPTYAKDLANATNRLLAGGHSGIFHITNRGACSWYEFAQKILNYAGLDGVPINPISSSQLTRPARRPRNSVLNCARFSEKTGKAIRFWQLALKEYLDLERMTGGVDLPRS